jgi:hypothetical protein
LFACIKIDGKKKVRSAAAATRGDHCMHTITLDAGEEEE